VILLANQYSISREACVRRLEELGLVPNGSWNYFQENGGITDKQAEEVLGEAAHRADFAKLDADRPLSHRMSLMAHNAWKQDLLSEGQLAELLQLERIELRSVIDEIELEDEENNELLKHN
jgi:Zn-dependent peptidase ImmA (M78 family)